MSKVLPIYLFWGEEFLVRRKPTRSRGRWSPMPRPA